jgi:hypothetical protein
MSPPTATFWICRSAALGGCSLSLPSSGPLGPPWGHIRATKDRSAADNTGHQRSGILPAHRPESAIHRRSPPPPGTLSHGGSQGVQIPSPPPPNLAGQSVARFHRRRSPVPGRAGAANHRGAAGSPRPARPGRRPQSASSRSRSAMSASGYRCRSGRARGSPKHAQPGRRPPWAAAGRPPARQRHDGHRSAGLTLSPRHRLDAPHLPHGI